MKFSKGSIQVVTLLISTFGLIATMFSLMANESNFLHGDNELILMLSLFLVAFLFITYSLLLVRRINPKQLIYVSCTTRDREVAQLVSRILSEQFERLSKYRFEIVTADSVPYGDDMATAVQKFISKSTMAIVLVSENYIKSDWCYKEFSLIAETNKKIIPIVLESYSDLSRLPKDISGIRALSLSGCSSTEEFEEQLLHLAKDLIRQRKD